ncbi:MAG TPA: c-type cytochrome [Leptospiraceae bacterium]|nr:c-type cytochrome [Leptospirales bacterium]HMU84373.1 c-type cytochrome [Leptospiraceae bacterium]HMW58122.1 c-type cytochrome [Leptospiraceae bacterium]HMX55649.1 c-type cytochrome [Leptospiraceae bacterium]HMY44077.1 c-type cytochrome [Leptospiraceae bacterium]
MLSKSQAKLFFLAGTALCAGLFLFLTVDTMRKIPEQTHEANITPEVERGKEIWDKNNCMGCHTLLGEGAYYAPELTKVYDRRGAEWMKVFLKDPQAMFPGERKMVKYNFSDQDITDLIAFFKWIGEMDLNGFPPKPNLHMTSSAATGPAVETPAKFKQLCVACHSLGGAGGNVGPALDGVGSRRDLAYIEKWLRDPSAIKPGAKMPKLALSEAEIKEISTFLAGLK